MPFTTSQISLFVIGSIVAYILYSYFFKKEGENAPWTPLKSVKVMDSGVSSDILDARFALRTPEGGAYLKMIDSHGFVLTKKYGKFDLESSDSTSTGLFGNTKLYIAKYDMAELINNDKKRSIAVDKLARNLERTTEKLNQSAFSSQDFKSKWKTERSNREEETERNIDRAIGYAEAKAGADYQRKESKL